MESTLVHAVTPAAQTTASYPALYTALVLYGLASVLYLSAFVDPPRWLRQLSTVALVSAFIVHGVDIGWRGVEGIHPGMGVHEALGFLSWLFVGGYLAALLKLRLAVMGAFVSPAALVILAAARLTRSSPQVQEISALGRVHISLATFGAAIFTVASLVAIVYLFQARALKSKKFDGVMLSDSTALDTLDRLSHRLLLVGFPIFTAAIVLGIFWVVKEDIELNRIEYPVSLIAWLVFGGLVIARTTRGWRGRHAAIVTMVGFASIVAVLLIYFIRGALS